jgi:hypothetical protein
MSITTNKNSSFALTSAGVAEKQNAENADKWGAELVVLSLLTGSRMPMSEAPESKKAKRAKAANKEKKEFSVSNGFKKFTGQASGADRAKVIQEVNTCLSGQSENPEFNAAQIAHTILMCVHKRDIDDGAGERDLSYWMFLELYHKYPVTMKKVLSAMVTKPYGSFLDLNKIGNLNKDDFKISEKKELAIELEAEIVEIYKNALESNNVAAAKWLPRYGKHDDRKTQLYRKVAKSMFPCDDHNVSQKLLRKKLSAVMANCKTVESKMCECDYTTSKNTGWEKIAENPEKEMKAVPGKAMHKYKLAFKDELKYGEKKGERRNPEDENRTKIRETLISMAEKMLEDPAANADLIKGGKTMQPHEIVQQIQRGSYERDLVGEAQFAGITQRAKEMGSLDRTVVMSDVSGSMSGTPMMVSIALGLIIAEVQTSEAWKNRILTFDSNPVWHEIDPKDNLPQKIQKLQNAPWGGSTNLQAAMNLVVNVAKSAKLSQEEMPKQLIIVTDMCFNQSVGSYDAADGELNKNALTHIDIAKNKFIDAGYQPPVIILWNVRSNDITFQNRSDDTGVICLGGFSVSLLKSLLDGDELDLSKVTPCELLLNTLGKERYFDIHKIIAETGEGDLSGYSEFWEKVKAEKAEKTEK